MGKYKKPEQEKTKDNEYERLYFETQTKLLKSQLELEDAQKAQFMLETKLIQKGVL